MADVVADASSTITVPVGGSPPAGYDSIETAYDYDWYRVSLVGGVTYTIRVVGAGTGDRTLGDPMIDGIYNSNDAYISGFNNDGLISGPNGRDAMVTFRPTASGANYYWVAVSGDLGTTGTYTISVTDSSGGTDNVAANTSTTGAITVGGAAVTGTIDNATDTDWYKVSLTAGTTYTIRMRGLTSGMGTLPDPVIAGVYDSSGSYIPNTYIDDFDTRDAALTFVAPSTGTFFIGAEGWRTRTGNYYENTPFAGTYYTGTFTLDIAVATPDIKGNTSTTATLNIGSSTTVTMGQPYDHDWYAVSLTAGQTYEFSLSGTGLHNNTPGIHGIFTAAGVYAGGYAAAVLGPGTAAATTIFTPTTSGTYYIDAFSLYEGTYTLSAAQIADDVPGNKTSTATVAVNGSVTGHIGGATDIDWYKVDLVGGNSYIVKVQGKQSNMGTLDDPLIAGIYDANGLLVASTFSDDSNGNEPSLVFRPSSTGAYFIAADGYSGYTGTYTLSVTQLAGDVGQTTATAAALSLNSPVTVTIDDAADTDWYAVTLNAGTTYGVRLNGAPTNRGTLADPVLLGLYDSTGAYIPDTFVDDTGGLLNAKLFFTPTNNGTYYVAADGYDRFTGTMRLAVTFDNIGTTNLTAGSLAVGGTVEGTIDTNADVDRYAVDLLASTTYYFRMLGLHSGNGDLVDPNISALRNTGGTAQTVTVINEATVVGKDSWIKFTTGSTGAGTYYLDLDGTGGEGEFLLTAVMDIAGSTATTSSIPLNGSNSSMIDDGTDADWFSMTLEAGKSYVVQMLALDTGNGTLTDPYINGVRFGTNTTAITGTTVNDVAGLGRDASVRFVATNAGTHYVAAQSNGTSAVGSYIVTLREDAGQTTSSAWTTLTIGGSVNGMIDDGPDIDWYKIRLESNTSYVFKMLGVDSGAGTLDDPTLALQNSSGSSVTTNRVLSSIGMDAVMRYYGTAGDYYINAQGGGSDYGTFLLTAEAEAGPTNGTAHAVTLDNAITGAMDDTSDVDRYSITLNANTRYRISMLGLDSGNGTLADPYLVLRNSSGTSLRTAEGGFTAPNRDAMIDYTPTTTATYYIDADATPSIIGTYKLLVELW
ncbi:MAG TPA: pre-peptidase C-terminal domain-containing protein [Noviherbaspirillum sp.]